MRFIRGHFSLHQRPPVGLAVGRPADLCGRSDLHALAGSLALPSFAGWMLDRWRDDLDARLKGEKNQSRLAVGIPSGNASEAAEKSSGRSTTLHASSRIKPLCALPSLLTAVIAGRTYHHDPLEAVIDKQRVRLEQSRHLG